MKYFSVLIILLLTQILSAQPSILELRIDTSEVKWTGETVNGRRNGVWIGTRSNRTYEMQYKNGVLDGTFRITRASGELYRTGSYANGLEHGVWIVYSSNDTSFLTTYVNGKKHGLYLRFQDNGLPFYVGQFTNDTMDGEWTEYAWVMPGQKNDRIKTVYNYKMGVLDGPAVATYTYAIKTTWYKNGVVQRTETKEIANNNNSKQSGNAVPEMITPVETTKKEPDLNEIVTYCEQMPSFKGGDAAFTKYLADSMRYPQAERDSMINGVVIMNFDVQKDGSITNVKAIRKVAGHPAFAEEAERLITNMPKWNPGKQDGKPVIVRMTHIIRFELK